MERDLGEMLTIISRTLALRLSPPAPDTLERTLRRSRAAQGERTLEARWSLIVGAFQTLCDAGLLPRLAELGWPFRLLGRPRPPSAGMC